MQIKQDFIQVGRTNRPRYSMKPIYITVHNTANLARTANAEMHSRYVKNPSTKASWHFTVDDGNVIYQHLPLTESGFHAGDGGGSGNRQSIGIEICENAGINQAKANDNAIWLIQKLMKDHKIPVTRVVPHKHWSGKNCPSKLLPAWDSFIVKIKNETNKEDEAMRKELDALKAQYNTLEAQYNRLEREVAVLKAIATPSETVSTYAKVAWLKAQNKGVLDGTNPRKPLTREQYATTLDRLGHLD